MAGIRATQNHRNRAGIGQSARCAGSAGRVTGHKVPRFKARGSYARPWGRSRHPPMTLCRCSIIDLKGRTADGDIAALLVQHFLKAVFRSSMQITLIRPIRLLLEIKMQSRRSGLIHCFLCFLSACEGHIVIKNLRRRDCGAVCLDFRINRGAIKAGLSCMVRSIKLAYPVDSHTH